MISEADLSQRIRERLNSLTKPVGSLGRLEELALRIGLIQGTEQPVCERKAMYVFCADHGVTAQGVSAYPQEVTKQMLLNFLRGGAAINVLCRHEGITPVIVDCGVRGEPVAGIRNCRLGEGTRDFTQEPAMSRLQAEQCLSYGRKLAEEAADSYDIVGTGEMGIGNTTAAAAILAVFSGADAEQCVGPGAGLDSGGVRRKAEVVRQALQLHRPKPEDPVGVLAAVGGFEIGIMSGFILAAARLRLPVVIDGFICGAAALLASRLSPDGLSTSIFAHRSAEPGHDLMLELVGARPLLDLSMRLGEGTGAALGIHIIEAAVRLYREMATFASAGVSTQMPPTTASTSKLPPESAR